MTLLETRALSHVYQGGVVALSGIDLTIRRGVRLAIVGANGAGKTTLLLHLNGILKPDSGAVYLDGREMDYSSAQLAAWRKRVGLVLQDADDQLFAATVAEDVSFGPLNLGLSVAEAQCRVDEALSVMGISALADRPTHMLSFGQKKRVTIAGAFAMRPEILLMDEPTAGLDHSGAAALLVAMEQLESAGTTLVFTTHDVDMAYEFAHEVAVFHDGKVLDQGETVSIFSNAALMDGVGLDKPLVLEIGLHAQSLGLLSHQDPLPRNGKGVLDMMQRFKG